MYPTYEHADMWTVGAVLPIHTIIWNQVELAEIKDALAEETSRRVQSEKVLRMFAQEILLFLQKSQSKVRGSSMFATRLIDLCIRWKQDQASCGGGASSSPSPECLVSACWFFRLSKLTRNTNRQLQLLKTLQKLGGGASLSAVDSDGRAASHWAALEVRIVVLTS